MTNEEKAIELSNKFKCITIGERCKNIEDACYKMAEWKEQQMIERACEWLKDWLESEDFGIPITASSRKSFLKEFKESMEE